LNVSAGTHAVGAIDGAGSTTVAPAATLSSDRVRQAELAVNGAMTIRAGSASASTSIATALSGLSSGKLDLTDGKMITRSDVGSWNSTNYSGLTGAIKTGRNGGAWNGMAGIVTSMSDAQGIGALRTIGIADASDVQRVGQTFGGVTLTAGDVMIAYTYGGDADLTGIIDSDDFFQIDQGFQNAATGYDNGDFNYDGRVDADDYFIINRNYARAALQASAPVEMAAGVSVVPEPANLTLLVVAGAVCSARRRRRRK
jgi:hypothetical protein